MFNIMVNASLERHLDHQALSEAHHPRSTEHDVVLDMSSTSTPQQEAAKPVPACLLPLCVSCIVYTGISNP